MPLHDEINALAFDFGENIAHFATLAGSMTDEARTQMQEYIKAQYVKEIDAIVDTQECELTLRNLFYEKLFKAKRKLAKIERADAFFDKIFNKYFSRGLLEHLIVHAIKFLHKNELFVAKRFIKQLDNDELLAQFTEAACEHLGWTSQNEPLQEATTDEEETIDDDSSEDGETSAQGTEEATEVIVYEPKEVQPSKPQTQPVVTLERTVTREVMTTANSVANSSADKPVGGQASIFDKDDGID